MHAGVRYFIKQNKTFQLENNHEEHGSKTAGYTNTHAMDGKVFQVYSFPASALPHWLFPLPVLVGLPHVATGEIFRLGRFSKGGEARGGEG